MTAKKLSQLISDVKAAGWAVEANEDGMTALSPDQVQKVGIEYLQGVFVEAWVEFPDQGRRVKLKNASAVRMQVTRPHEAKPVKVYTAKDATLSERPVDDLPLDAREILPFSLDDPTPAILAVVAGRRIVWRNTEMNRIESARLPEDARRIRVVVHPRYRRRMVVWADEKGPCTVLLDRVRRVLP